MDAVVDRFVVGRKHEKAIKAGIAATLLVGDGLLQVQIVKGAGKAETERFYKRPVQQDAPLRLRRHPARVCLRIRHRPSSGAAPFVLRAVLSAARL